MRPSIRLATCATILVAFAAPAGAQGILGRITKKAADAVEKKAEDKVNAKIDQVTQKMVDNSFAALFGDSANPAPGGTGGGGSGARAGSMPFSIGSNAKTEASYTFDVVTTMETETSKRGKSDGKAVLKFHFNSNAPYTGTSIASADGKSAEGTAFVILDAKNQAMVMLMASDKSKFSIAYDWKEAQKYAESAASAPSEQVNWDTVTAWRNYKRIGTKTIAGYSAEGYRSEGQDGTAEIWVSRDRRLAGGRMFGANSGLRQMKGRVPADYPYGMVLEMTGVNANSGDTFTMKVTNIETNARVAYAMSDYPRMEVGKK